jgi:thioesterase domain-containing protein/acyl carrier protein
VLYRTGDYGSWNADGTLAFAGRRDRQVKVRGFRVELDAIERRLAALGGAAQLVVDIDRTDSMHPHVVAHYVAESGCAIGTAALFEAARAILPAHEVPGRFVEHATLPLTAEGKIDRRALRQQAGDAGVAAATAVTLAGRLEQTVAAVWRDVLNVPIHAESDFFDLGGDSLQALRAVLELERRLHFRVSLNMLFRARTPRTLAASLVQRETLPNYHYLVPLRIGNGRADVAIFFVHGSATSLLSILPVATMLPPHIPVYGLQGDPETVHGRDFVHIASDYVREIRRFQPQGPYFLAGHSLGGLFAHEVARQLAMAGEDVARLFLIDAYPANLPAPLRWAMRWSHLVLSLPEALTMAFVRRLGRKVASVALTREVVSVAIQAVASRRARPLSPFHELKRRHRPMPYSGCATLFLAHRTTGARRLGWQYLVRGGLEVKRVPGTHMSMLRDGLASIAATVAAHYDCRSSPHRQSVISTRAKSRIPAGR